jgi:hypothetical protein
MTMDSDARHTSTADEFDTHLLEDARLVAGYAYRSGQLKDDSILTELTQFEEDLAARRKPNRAQFAAKVSKLVAAIAPMTLQDLRDQRDAFSLPTGKISSRAQMIMSSLALLVMFAVGYYSLVLNEQWTALDAYNEIKTSRLDDKFTELRKHWRDLVDSQVPEDARFDVLHHEIEEIRTIRLQSVAAAQRIERAQRLWSSLFVRKGQPTSAQEQEEVASKSDKVKATSADGNDTPASAQHAALTFHAGDRVTTIAGVPSGGNGDSSISKYDYELAVKNATAGPLDLCAIERNLRSIAVTDYPIWAQALLRDLAEELCIRTQLDIASVRGGPVDLAPQYIYVVKENISLLQSWILPGLLGLLGATFYLLRNLYDVRTPYTGALTALSRIMLGGVAGIAVGWLAGSHSQDGSGFSSASLATALVAGFSVDIVFSLLDRVKKTISSTSPAKLQTQE